MYHYSYVHQKQLFRHQHYEKNILFEIVANEYRQKGIHYNDQDLMAAIERQSNSKLRSRQSLPIVKKKTLTETIHGAKALIRYMGGQAVTEKELERRSLICNNCPLKDSVSDCMSCGGSGKVAAFINRIRRSKKVEGSIPESLRKKYCGMCGCSLPLLLVTQFKDFEVEDAQKNSARPDHCWLKKTSINFTKE